MNADNPSRYGSLTRFLHWGMALGYGTMFVLAWTGMITLHKILGMAMLVLTLWRLAWVWKQATARGFNSWAVRWGHRTLYVLMLGVPILGILRQVGVPLGRGHGVLATLFLLLVVGHVGMAIYHRYRNDGVWSKMA